VHDFVSAAIIRPVLYFKFSPCEFQHFNDPPMEFVQEMLTVMFHWANIAPFMI
jgi:hypothetical protein